MKFPNQFNSAAAYKNFVRYQKKQEKDWKIHTASAASLSSVVGAAYGGISHAESKKKMIPTMPALGMIGGTDLSAKKSVMSSAARGRDFHQMAMAQKATFLLALFSLFQSATAAPLSRRDGVVAKDNKALDRVDPKSVATKVDQQKKNAVAVHSSLHSLAQHHVGLFLMRAYVSKKSLSSNEASVEIIAQSKSTAPLEKKSHQRRATPVISDGAAAQSSNSARAIDNSAICAFSENSIEFIASQSEVAAAVIMNREIFRGLSGNNTLTPGNNTDVSIDPILNSIDFPARIECIEKIATTFLVFKEIEAWVDWSRASTQINNPYQAFLAIAARAGYPDNHLSIEYLGQILAQGKNIDDWLTEASVEQRHQFHQAALLYMQTKYLNWPVWSSISCFQIRKAYPLSMLRDMAGDISRVYDHFATQVREAWQKSQIFFDRTLNDQAISQSDALGDGVDFSAENEIPQEPTAPKRCVDKSICFDGVGLVHAKGKTFDDLLDDTSLALIPGFAALNRQTQQRLVRERLHRIGQSTEYTFGTIQHSMASTLITLLLIKGQPIPENFGTEAELVLRFMAECKQWEQEKNTVSPGHLMGLHLSSVRGEEIFSKKSTPQQRIELINDYAKEVMLAHYGEAPKQYIRDQRITALIMKKFNLRERDVKIEKERFSSCGSGSLCEEKWLTLFERFNQIIDRKAFTDNIRINGRVIYPEAALQEDEEQYNAELLSNNWIQACAKENLRKNNKELTTGNINNEVARLAKQYKTRTENERDWERGLTYFEKIPILGGVISFFDGLVNLDIDKIVGAIPVIGTLYNIVQAIRTQDWQRFISVLPIINNLYDIEEGLRKGDAISVYLGGANLLVEMGSYHEGPGKSAQPMRILSAVELPENLAHGIQINSAFSEKIGLSFQGVKLKEFGEGAKQKNNHVPMFNFEDPFGIKKTKIEPPAEDDIAAVNETAEENRPQATEDTSHTDISEDDTWLVCGARVKRAPDLCFSGKEKRDNYFSALKNNIESDEKVSCQKRFAMSEVFKMERRKLSATENVDLSGEYKRYRDIREREVKRQGVSEIELDFNKAFTNRLAKREQAILNNGIDALNEKFDSDFAQKELSEPGLKRSDFIRLPKFKLTAGEYPSKSVAQPPLILIQLEEGESTENVAEGLHAVAASIMHNTDLEANFKIQIGDICKDQNIIIVSNAPRGKHKPRSTPQDQEVAIAAAEQDIIIDRENSLVYFVRTMDGKRRALNYADIKGELKKLFDSVPADSAAKTIYTFLQKGKWVFTRPENMSLETEQNIKVYLAIYGTIVSISEEQRTTGTAVLVMRIYEEYATAPDTSALLPKMVDANGNNVPPPQSVFFNPDNQLLPFMEKQGTMKQRELTGSPQQRAHKNRLAKEKADAQNAPPKKRLKTADASDGAAAVLPSPATITVQDIRDELWGQGPILTRNAVL